MNARSRAALLVLVVSLLAPACGGNGSTIYVAAALRKIFGEFAMQQFLELQLLDLALRREYAAGLATKWSSSTLGVPDKAPSARTDLRQIGVLRSYFDQPALDDFAAMFPAGHGNYAYRFDASPAATLEPGFYTIAYGNLRANFPIDVQDRHFQYAFVWDRDGDRSNDYQGTPPFDQDFFQGSDTWFQLQKQPNQPWSFTVQDARNGSVRSRISKAVALVCDDVFAMLLSDDEYDELLYSAKFRATAFEHGGDYGLAAPHDWFGSVRPERDTFLFGPNWSAIQKYEPQIRIEAKLVQGPSGYLNDLGVALDPLAMYADFDAVEFPVRNREDADLVLRNALIGGLGDGLQFVPAGLDYGQLATRAGLSSADVFTGWSTLPGARSFAVDDAKSVGFTASLSANYAIPFLPGAAGSTGEVYGKLGDNTLWDSSGGGNGGVSWTAPTLRLFDGQRSVLQLRDRIATVDNLEAGYRSAVELAFPGVSSVATGPTIDVQAFVRRDLSLELSLRLDARGVALESNETIDVQGIGATMLEVPFLAHGRTLKGAVTVNSGQTLLLGGVQDLGAPSITEGLPWLGNVPVLNRLLAPAQRTDENQRLFLVLRPTLVMPEGF